MLHPSSDLSSRAPADDAALDRLVRVDQIDMAVMRSKVSNWLGVPVVALQCWILAAEMPHRWLAIWFGLKVVASLLRGWATWGYERDRQTRPEHWGRRFEWTVMLDGAVFGLCATWLLPVHDAALAATMVATVVGIASIGLVVLSINLRASMALVTPLLLPAMAYQLWLGDPRSVYMGIGIGIYLGLLIVEGRKADTHTRSMLRLRYQMDDLAAQRQAALDLAQRNSAVKDRFLANMSHEMRTPLHGIIGLARLLKNPAAGGPPGGREGSLTTLQRTGEHLLGIINDVLDFSKIEGGHMRLGREAFELGAVLESVADVSQVAASEKGLALVLASALPAPCWVVGDATRLRQILLNLTGNAAKFTARGGITIHALQWPDGATVFDVTDTGEGVPAHQRESIFAAFHQIDNSDGRRHGGTGLGLTISRELARAMGGDLVCLQSDDGGSTFRLTALLPATAAPAADALVPDTSPARLEARVLLAEDNPVNALVTGAILQRFGIEVLTVTDGAQAVAQAMLGGYDLILMDCQMPGVDGFEATQRIRAFERSRARAPVPIVALTANALEGDRERSLASGMNDHLSKPFREADMAALLKRYIAA